jgi:hypothetical protein
MAMSQTRLAPRLVERREEETMQQTDDTRQGWVGPDLPSLSGIVFGSIMFVTGVMLLLTIIGIPLGLPLFAAGLGWMLSPKDRATR